MLNPEIFNEIIGRLETINITLENTRTLLGEMREDFKSFRTLIDERRAATAIQERKSSKKKLPTRRVRNATSKTEEK